MFSSTTYLKTRCLSLITSRIPKRYYTSLFKPSFTAQEYQYAMENVKLSVRKNPVDIRRTYWFHVYKNVLSSRYIFVLQNNNIPASLLQQLRIELKKSDVELLNVRNRVFKAAVEQKELKNLFQGQTMVWFSNSTDEQNPQLLQQVYTIFQKYKQFVYLTGGRMEGIALTADTLQEYKSLPPKAQLFAELLGLIEYPGSAIARVLSTPPQQLSMNLEQHVKQLSEIE